MIRTVLVDAAGLAPYAEGLRALERDITYPLSDGADRFWIDHGPDYHPFFTHLGEGHFLLCLDGPRVVGTITGVLRHARANGVPAPTAYLCDFKIARSHRGGRVARTMLLTALGLAATQRRFQHWRYAYGAAMRGASGDVMRSARGLHPGRLFAPAARLRLFFASADALAALDPAGCPLTPCSTGLDLSPGVPVEHPLGLVSTAGRKDLRRVSSGAPWPLVHLGLGPAAWPGRWVDYLRLAAAAAAAEHPGALCCFALDERLAAHLAWITAAGLPSDTVCTVYAWRLPGGPRAPAWVHLSTSEI
ncbi:MAG: GNAT family N-acetyltransferase [Deltaproteobacteria bacterium]|nr:GNAT family N-acetyltransferase [Myxococcales bacterium]MDP3221278.1 GNAT family N-acetyltransferase [Deltaproteobacteria bacterium]